MSPLDKNPLLQYFKRRGYYVEFELGECRMLGTLNVDRLLGEDELKILAEAPHVKLIKMSEV